MNRRLFMGLLTGLAAIPAAVIAAVKSPKSLPSEPKGVFVPELKVSIDVASDVNQDMLVACVWARGEDGKIWLWDMHEWTAEEAVNIGEPELMRRSKYMTVSKMMGEEHGARFFVPTRLHDFDLPAELAQDKPGDWHVLALDPYPSFHP